MLPKKRRVPREKFTPQRNQRRVVTEYFWARVSRNNLEHNRYAVVVSTKVDKRATRRHFIKRTILDAAHAWCDTSLDVIITALPSAQNLSKNQIREEVHLLEKKLITNT